MYSFSSIKTNRFVRGIYFIYKMFFHSSKKKYGYIGNNVTLTPPVFVGNPSNVFIYDDVGIGYGLHLSATNAKVVIKGKCAIAENLTIHTGNHARKIGLFVSEITEKTKPDGYDADVIIENDVWIGCNVTILSGVTVGRGCTIAAGAVVTRDAPPYSIIGGVPAKVLKFYWNVEQIMEHEKRLYPEGERMSKEELINIIK